MIPHLDGLNLIILYPLIAIYKALIFIHIPHPLGISIILLTILIRLILYPVITSQLRASKKMQELGPRLSEIKDKYKGNSAMISQETMKLYKDNGINPAAGCLPVIVQLPVIWILYSVLQNIVKNQALVTAEINRVVQVSILKLNGPLDQSFFLLPLGKTPAQLFHPSFPAAMVLLVPLATGFFQYIQSKMMFPKPVQNAVKKSDDFSSIFASQSTYIFPIMIGFFSYSFPIGLSLYWNTFTIFGIVQQHLISGGSFKNIWPKKK
ncbi:MAG TPA: YidC/Oxa1 family membrane protein insertase [Patescibacteria group bacterium]|nr:YidC/Oxa1 family membrane protein insertase [Patescibacteria group bacterium]